MLIDNRKFDIRTYTLATGRGDYFIYSTGYLRLSSAEFDVNAKDVRVHLTNNAVQKHLDEYNKFEEGNMLSFSEFG